MQLADLTHAPNNKNEALKEYDLISWVNLLDYNINEYGFNQPMTQNSRYKSGTRNVDNPAWFTAQQQLQSAQNDYNNSYSYYQQMESNCDSMGGFAAAICRGSLQGIRTIGIDNARNAAASTPRYLQEDIINDYSYRYFKVGLSISLKAQVQTLDRKNNILLSPKLAEYELKNKEGEIYESVMYDDVNGLKNQKINVPDLQSEKQTAQNSIIESIKKALQIEATRNQGLRYCQAGENIKREGLKNKKLTISMLNNYQLCLTFKKESNLEADEKTKLTEDQNELNKFYQTSPEEIDAIKFSDIDPSI